MLLSLIIAVLHLAGLLASLLTFALEWRQEDPRFEGDKLIYRS